MSRFAMAVIAIIGLSIAIPTPAAQADDRCGRQERCDHDDADADIESIKASLDWAEGEWCLSVRFEVELEDFRSCDAFDLVVTPLHRGQPLADPAGQTLGMAAPLPIADRCDDDDDDEVELDDGVSMRLAEGLICDPHCVKVFVEVVNRATGRVLDDDTVRVRVRSAPHHVEVHKRVEVWESTSYSYPPPAPDYPPSAADYPPPPVHAAPPVVINEPPLRCGCPSCNRPRRHVHGHVCGGCEYGHFSVRWSDDDD